MVFKKAVKKSSPVIVETKKHEEVSCCNDNGKKFFGILVVILLLLNLAVGVWNSLNSNSARNIEALKVGGKDNLQLVKKLYQMDTYKEQQKGAIMQVLNSFVGGTDTAAQGQAVIPAQEAQQQLPVQAPAITQ